MGQKDKRRIAKFAGGFVILSAEIKKYGK